MPGTIGSPVGDQIITNEVLLQNCPEAPRKSGIRERGRPTNLFDNGVTPRRLFADVEEKKTAADAVLQNEGA